MVTPQLLQVRIMWEPVNRWSDATSQQQGEPAVGSIRPFVTVSMALLIGLVLLGPFGLLTAGDANGQPAPIGRLAPGVIRGCAKR